MRFWRPWMFVALLPAAGCGRESLLIDLGGGNAVGGAGTGAGDTGGTGGSGGSGGGCVPAEEICDQLDNDCDGDVDEGCQCNPGETQSCYSGPPDTDGVGPCHAGTQVCEKGTFGPCSGEVTPLPEKCDGADNDCDGGVDDGNPDGGEPCFIGLPGVCSEGVTQCQNGNFVCKQQVMPSPEQCDGLDNNCNGTVDDNAQGTGTPCNTGLPGVCAVGTTTCDFGMFGCTPNNTGMPETCDGLDNNCNDVVDEGNPGGGANCLTGLAGVCSLGVQTCQGGTFNCVGPSPTMESCDGADNDCNSVIDDVPGLGTACNTGLPGACAAGTLGCSGNMLKCNATSAGSPEVCDGLDNNCNGTADEGNPGGGAACNTGFPGACANGILTCQAGTLSCLPMGVSATELCAGSVDEDCDGQTATVFFTESFANNSAGWTLDQEWQIGSAMASMGGVFNPDPAMDHTATDDNGLAGVVIGGNASTMIHPFRWLTSPVVNLDPNSPKVYLQFWRWLNSDYTPFMQNRVEVFDGIAWITVWQSGGPPGVQDTMWTKQVFDVTPFANAAFQVRVGFRIQSGGAFIVSQWNIDDISLVSEPCD